MYFNDLSAHCLAGAGMEKILHFSCKNNTPDSFSTMMAPFCAESFAQNALQSTARTQSRPVENFPKGK
jgi:hypothetical protein